MTAAPLSVLFLCTANICRSPYMELSARSLVGEGPEVEFASAGTHGWRDEPMHPPMAELLEERGVDSSSFRSRPANRQLLAAADLVVTAEASHRTWVLEEAAGSFRKVFTLGQLATTIAATPTDLTGAAYLRSLSEHRVPAATHLDVQDPYRRGPEAARAAADHIDSFLRVVVPALVASGRITPWTT